jgi:hypothetical protein
MTGVKFPAGAMIGFFLFATVSRPALWPTKPHIQWVPAFSSPEFSDRGVKLTTHLHLMPRLRMRGTIPPLPQYVFRAWNSIFGIEISARYKYT